MNAMNVTPIALEVKAISALGLAEQISEIEYRRFELGLFAAQDYAIAVSMTWDVRVRMVSLMNAQPTTAQGPREGTYAAEREPESQPDFRDRVQEFKELQFKHSVLSRVEEHLAAKAKDESVQVRGPGVKPTQFYEFRPYMSSLAGFIKDRRSFFLQAGGSELQVARLDELSQYDERDFEGAGIGINEALDHFAEYVAQDENLDRVAFNAWTKLRSNLRAYGEGLLEFENARVFLNSVGEPNSAMMSTFAGINAKWNTRAFKLGRAIKNNLAATPLLAHAGVPLDLIDSSEWATMVIDAETAKMQKDAMLLEAQIRQVRAKQVQVDLAKKMAALQAEMESLLAPKPVPVTEEVKEVVQPRRLNGKQSTFPSYNFRS